MAKQDDFIRFTLRIPPDLHQKLIEATGAGSLNAEIVSRLQKTFVFDKVEMRSGVPFPKAEGLQSAIDALNFMKENLMEATVQGLLEAAELPGEEQTSHIREVVKREMKARQKAARA